MIKVLLLVTKQKFLLKVICLINYIRSIEAEQLDQIVSLGWMQLTVIMEMKESFFTPLKAKQILSSLLTNKRVVFFRPQ